MTPEQEAQHLGFGSDHSEVAGLYEVVALRAKTPNPELLINRCRSVMQVVVSHQDGPWPDIKYWRESLPSWFLEACGNEQTVEEASPWLEHWRSLDPAKQVDAVSSRVWSLSSWLHWLEPSERTWFWWDAHIEIADVARVEVAVENMPTALGAIEWLIRAAGASQVDIEGD